MASSRLRLPLLLQVLTTEPSHLIHILRGLRFSTSLHHVPNGWTPRRQHQGNLFLADPRFKRSSPNFEIQLSRVRATDLPRILLPHLQVPFSGRNFLEVETDYEFLPQS